MQYIKLFLVLLFVYSNISYSQVTPIASSSEKYNERGISSDLSFKPNGSEMINDYDGNLLVKYQTPLKFSEELSGELSVVYNANVPHRTFNYNNDINGYMINAPEWVIGYKGVALQALNFETNYLIEFINNNTNSGEQVSLFIAGYHFTNSLKANNLQPTSKDFIYILMADGSVKILQNVDQISSDNSREGLYIEKGVENYGIAKVEIYSGHFRRIWYKPGDGLTYFFEEEAVSYYDWQQGAINSEHQFDPKIMYLKKIISSSGDELEFIYNNQLGGINITYGRKIFVGIKSNRRTSHSSDYELQMTYEWDSYLRSIQINNYNFDDFLKLHIYNANPNLFGTSRDPDGSRILYLSRVEDKLGRYDDFTYYPLTDELINRFFTYIGQSYTLNFHLNYNFYLVKGINFFNKQKIQYEYFGQLYSGGTAILYLHFQEHQIPVNVDVAFRDCFTNFMIKKRKLYTDTQLVNTETYNYSRTGTGGIKDAQVNNIITTITTENNLADNSSPPTITKEKNFSKYNTFTLDYTLGDVNGIVKLAKEKEVGGTDGYFEKSYSYNIGSLVSGGLTSYYNGTFNLESVNIIRNDGINPSLNLNQTITNNYTVVNYKNINGATVSTKKMFNNVTKDEENLNTEIGFKNFTATDYDPTLSTTYFYKIGLTETDKIYSGSLIKKHKSFTYNTSGELVGKLSKETDVLSGNNFVEYDYYTTSTNNFYRGFLKSEIRNTTGLKKEYYYPANTSPNDWQISDAADGKVIKYDGTVFTKTFNHTGFQLKPFKTITSFKNYEVASDNFEGTTNFEIWDNNTIRNLGVNPQTVYSKKTGSTLTTKHSYSFFNQPAILNDKIIYDGTLTLNIKTDFLSPSDLTRELEIYGVTEAYRSGETNYQTQYLAATILPPESLNDYVTININFGSSLNTLQDQGKDLHGFKFSFPTDVVENHEVRYLISGNPLFELLADTYTTETNTVYTSYDQKGNLKFEIDANGNYSQYSYDGMGRLTYEDLPLSFYDINNSNHSSIYEYFDSDNYLTETKRFDNNPSNLKSLVTKKEFDPLVQLIKTSVKDDAGNFILKNEKKYNYLGLIYEDITGTGVTTKYTFDYLSRIKTSRLGTLAAENYLYRWETGTVTNGSTSKTYYGKKTITDPSGIIKYIYYDKVGNFIAEKSGTNTPLIYTLDNIYRITSSLSPGGLTTNYTYDSRGNLNSKSSPDEGEYKYKYDKYGNLRFTFHTTSTPAEIVFNYYDDFNNLVAVGVHPGTLNDFNSLNADYHYSFETDTSKQLTVNMYNHYIRTGVFTSLPDYSQQILDNMNMKDRLVAVAFRDKSGQSFNHKINHYDPLGRTKEFVSRLSQYDWKSIYNNYDNLGNITKQQVENLFYYWYDYDLQGRLKEVRTNNIDNKTSASLEASCTYNNADQQTAIINAAGNVSYGYHPQSGWVNNIQQSANVFREQLTYFDNGNINQQIITNQGNGSWQNLTFNYTYDFMNRLTNSTVSNSTFNETFSYSADGNLETKNRSGKNISYSYNGGTNKLSGVTINSNNYTFGFNSKGNIVSDSRKNITFDYYDNRNLPLQMTRGSETYYYRYDDNGNRIYRRTPYTTEYYLRDHLNKELAVYDPVNNKAKVFNIFGNGLIGKVVTGAYDNLYLTNTILEGTYEATNSITAGTNVIVNGTATLKAGNSIHLKPGFHAANGSNFNAKIGTVSTALQRYYHIKDHLGSIRVTTDETGTVISAQDYFAYGELLREHNAVDRYKFTEKERDTETDYDYFGARYYDNEIGRWLSVDPLSDSYPAWSPYSYAGNNPLNAIDINGMDWVYIFGYGWVWELPEVEVTAPAWWRDVANEKLDRFGAEFNTAQVIPFPLNPVAPPIVGPMESPSKTGKGILELFDKVNELGTQIELTKLILATYITNLVIPTNLETRKSGKEKGSDIPSWAEGTKPLPGESGKEYAKRLCDGKYGPGNYDTGPGSEYNKLKKYGDRSRK
ncbi:MAG: hypothetical protein DAHOPDDO_00808 [Ignavibacteriaceae bacterium]|nr:hypothetical protein [Ignavibacteriaceae bacterium]